MKRIFVSIMALVLGLSAAGCRNRNVDESSVDSQPVGTTSVSETKTEASEEANASKSSENDESATENITKEQQQEESTQPETYIYDENGLVDIDKLPTDSEVSSSQKTTPETTESESVDDAGNAIV